MSTHAYDTVLAHTTDAEFRAWGAPFEAGLIAIGLTKTADSGQINWSTVTIPGPNTEAGYAMYRFNDALQATKPIFIRFGFGTGGGSDYPRITVRMGIATDGSGNLTGISTDTDQQMTQQASVVSPGATPFPTHMCYSAALGVLTIAWKLGGLGINNPGYGFLAVERSCNSTGAPTGDGATLFTFDDGNPFKAQALSFGSPNVAYAKHQNYGQVIGNVTSSMVGASIQAYLAWTHYPRVEPCNGICGLIEAEVGRTLLATTLVGATDHTYLSLGQNSPNFGGGSNATAFCVGMLYE